MKSIITILNSPYPKEDRDRAYYKKLALISLFVAIFLFVFRPFNLSATGSSLWIHCLVFGVITFVVSSAYDLLINDALNILSKDETHVLWKWVLNTMGLLICIGIANFCYMHFSYNMPWSYLGSLITATFLVGIFPILFMGMLVVIRGEQKYEAVAKDMKKSVSDDQVFKVVDVNGITSNNIIYIEGLQNYVQIFHLNEENKTAKSTQRSTMKSLEEALIGTSLSRCHRSFFVNKSLISDVSGNAQGLKLTLEYVEKKIPVSRRFIPQFKTK